MKPRWLRIRAAAGRLRRGFTLVELMVAVTGGLFVTIAVFLLAKQSTGLYQAEARISNATLGSVVGFERLRADLERMGFLVTPNLLKDPKFCGTVDSTYPAYLARLSSVFIQRTAAVPPELAANGIAPDEIVMAGAYGSSDQFATEEIAATSNGHLVTLRSVGSPAMARLGYQTKLDLPKLEAVFGAGRILRVVDTAGREQYGTISKVQLDPDDRPQIVLELVSPALLYRGGNQDSHCGIQGTGIGSLVNIVNLVKYSIRSLNDPAKYPQYAPLYDQASYDGVNFGGAGQRSELVREELDSAGNTIEGTEEIVAEFAVDLAFGVTVAQTVATSGGGPMTEQLLTYPPGDDTEIAKWAGNPTSIALNLRGPQLVRAVRARLSIRSRQADRDTAISGAMTDGGGEPISPGLYRIGLGGGDSGTAAAPYARVRTVQTDVAMRNHRGALWRL